MISAEVSLSKPHVMPNIFKYTNNTKFMSKCAHRMARHQTIKKCIPYTKPKGIENSTRAVPSLSSISSTKIIMQYK